MNIVVLDGYTLNPGDISWNDFETLGDLTVYDRTDENDIVSRIGQAEIVYTNKTPITKEILDQCPSIKYIGVLATGYNVVDINAAKEKNIPVCNIPTYGTDAVSQFVFALILALCHRVEYHSQTVFNGEWAKSKDFSYWHTPLVELAGKTLGIIGAGKIGKRTADIGLAFGMTILAYDPHPQLQYESDDFKYASLDEIYAQSDFISLHVPLFESTRGIINATSISKMKKGVMLINTSRGPLIDEVALVEGLKSGKISGAALDVVSTEPIEENSILFDAPNLIITPHIAWAPKESRERLMAVAVSNLSNFLNHTPVNVVNGII